MRLSCTDGSSPNPRNTPPVRQREAPGRRPSHLATAAKASVVGGLGMVMWTSLPACGTAPATPANTPTTTTSVTIVPVEPAPTTAASATAPASPAPRPAWVSDACVARTKSLLGQMSLAEKAGQMVQANMGSLVSEDDIAKDAIGSILFNGDEAPTVNAPNAWADLTDGWHAQALKSRLKIPLLVGIDAVHGNAKISGATVFPHAIGLSSTGDASLVEEVGRMTALEVLGSGSDWAFSPVVAVARDERWGRTYESFGETPDLAGTFGAAMVKGLQAGGLGSRGSVLACAKHYAGDGGTKFGSSTKKPGGLLDQGDTVVSEEELRSLHIAPYRPAIAAHVGSIMVSYSSWNGRKMHGQKGLITDVLKGELGFGGLVISDYDAIDQLPGSYVDQVEASVNAGIDMAMVGGPAKKAHYRDFTGAVQQLVSAGKIPMSRVDDAVTRILQVKCAMGLFESNGKADRTLTSQIGAPDHRAVARRAVAKSLVLLKNDRNVLPLKKDAKRIAVVGPMADSLKHQSGGWTIDWQGESMNLSGKASPKAKVVGTTLLAALRASVSKNTKVTFSADGSGIAGADVVVVVVGEEPYAENFGDRADLHLSKEAQDLLAKVKASKVPSVAILYSGRPMLLDNVEANADAWVAAWLPGSEGAGITDVLFGDVKPTGKLVHTWPKSQIPINTGDSAEARWPLGHGLTYP